MMTLYSIVLTIEQITHELPAICSLITSYLFNYISKKYIILIMLNDTSLVSPKSMSMDIPMIINTTRDCPVLSDSSLEIKMNILYKLPTF